MYSEVNITLYLSENLITGSAKLTQSEFLNYIILIFTEQNWDFPGQDYASRQRHKQTIGSDYVIP